MLVNYANALHILQSVGEPLSQGDLALASDKLYTVIEILQSIRNDLARRSREVPAIERMMYAHFPPFDGEET